MIACLAFALLSTVHDPSLRIGNGPPPPDQSSCRVGERPASWVEARIMPPYTGIPPVTTVEFEACAYAEMTLRYENQATLMPGFAMSTGQAIRFQAALDPSFGVPVIDLTVPVADLIAAGMAYDGTTDFAGLSGATVSADNALFQTQTFNVAQFGDFFRQPWTLYLRATFVDRTYFFQAHGGAYTAIHEPVAACGVVAVYNP